MSEKLPSLQPRFSAENVQGEIKGEIQSSIKEKGKSEAQKGKQARVVYRGFWTRVSFVLCAMATYKAATGFTSLVIPLVLVEMPSIPEDETEFNFWVSLQVFAIYFGETIGEFLTGILTDRYPKMLKKMLLVVLFLAAASYFGQGVVVWLLLEEELGVVMTYMTIVRFFNGFFSPAVLGSLATFQLVEREMELMREGAETDLRAKVENMRPVALYLGDMVGCLFIGLGPVLSLPWLFFLIGISNILMFFCIWFFIPDPIYSGDAIMPGEGVPDDLDEEMDEKVEPIGPVEVPNWHLFKYYTWNRAVIYIFLANMLNSLFNSIVGSAQIVYLDITELWLALENLLGSLFGVGLAWAFMTYLYRKMKDTKSLLLTGILSFISIVGMPWFMKNLWLSIGISIIYTPIIITQDAIAIISGATFAVKTVENSEGFAYGFLNGASMIACGIAPFIYTALLALMPKSAVWFTLAGTFLVLMLAEFIYQIVLQCRKRSNRRSKPLHYPYQESKPIHKEDFLSDNENDSRYHSKSVTDDEFSKNQSEDNREREEEEEEEEIDEKSSLLSKPTYPNIPEIIISPDDSIPNYGITTGLNDHQKHGNQNNPLHFGGLGIPHDTKPSRKTSSSTLASRKTNASSRSNASYKGANSTSNTKVALANALAQHTNFD